MIVAYPVRTELRGNFLNNLGFMTALAMVAFAANSVLTRVALSGDGADAPSFGLIRVAAGAAILAIVILRRPGFRLLPDRKTILPSLALTLYIVGFSMAYLGLQTGVGALILFGGVQVTMFLFALFSGQTITAQKWLGTALAFAGVVWLLLPGAAAPPLLASIWMVLAALGWGLYSVLGKRAQDPLAETQKAFLLSVPMVLVFWIFAFEGNAMPLKSVILAIVSGAVTSALGYALWYKVLPRLQTTTAAVAQLTVPSIAMAGGIIFLAEPLTLRFIGASVVVIVGVLVATGVVRR